MTLVDQNINLFSVMTFKQLKQESHPTNTVSKRAAGCVDRSFLSQAKQMPISTFGRLKVVLRIKMKMVYCCRIFPSSV